MRTTITGEKWLRDANFNVGFAFDGSASVFVNTESVLTVEEKNYPTPDKSYHQAISATDVIELVDEAGIPTGDTITIAEFATIARSVRVFCEKKANTTDPITNRISPVM